MVRIAVVHYQPLEFYPPVTNFLDVASKSKKLKIRIFSTNNSKGRENYKNNRLVSIYRGASVNLKESKIIRLLKYFSFNICCLFKLIKYRPNKIVYFESYSAWPVYWFLKYFGEKVDLYIHNHEYFDSSWYQNGMKLLRKYNRYEKNFLYSKAIWLSQTNNDRIKLFLSDNKNVNAEKIYVLPNYPPKSWNLKPMVVSEMKFPLKIVYVGSLSLQATYIKEFCTWVVSQKGKVLFDIFSYNIHEDTQVYLKSLHSEYINFFSKGVEYHAMPETLSNYHIGVIFYKGLSKNFVYNAPNKLFEYLACGLTVLYSDIMLGIAPHKSDNIIPINFEKMDIIKPEDLVNRNQNSINIDYCAENALAELIKSLEL